MKPLSKKLNKVKFCKHLVRLQSMWSTNFQCTINESIKGAASLRRYGITFDGNIDIKYTTLPVTYMFFHRNCMPKE